MKYKILITLVIIISFSSCKPRYMRCPKKKRCVVTPQKKIVFKNTPYIYTILAKNYTI